MCDATMWGLLEGIIEHCQLVSCDPSPQVNMHHTNVNELLHMFSKGAITASSKHVRHSVWFLASGHNAIILLQKKSAFVTAIALGSTLFHDFDLC